MLNFIAGMRPSSPALSSPRLGISSQHLLGEARAYKTVENLEEAKKSYEKAVEQAKTEQERNPGDLKAKRTFDTIREEYFTFLSGLPLSERQEQGTAANQEKSKQVDYLFEKALSTLSFLELSNTTSLFLVYAHDNPAYGKADAQTSKYLIEKLSQIRVNLYSDQTPMGQAHSRASEALKENGKLEDILTSQLCLLPTRLRDDVEPVHKVVVCCSEVLEKYLKEWPYYDSFYQQLRVAYRKDSEQRSTSAIREVVRTFSQEPNYKIGFHHVLTEMAFLRIRAEQREDQHGIIPVSLTPKSAKQCLKDVISQTTVRMEDIPRFEAKARAGQEVYPNQSRHLVLFKLIERLLVSSGEAKTFLNKFWQGYSACISRLESGSSPLGWSEFVKLVDDIFGDIQRTLHNELALTVQQQHQQLKHQQGIELRSKKEPLAILGENIEEEYFAAWEEPGEIQDGLAMYVVPHATTITDRQTTFNLEEAVRVFLTQKNDSGQKTQVLLLQGKAGAGKSTFNRQLARRLWREYSAAPAPDKLPIPLYISLPTVKEPNENLIGQYLSKKCGFSPEQIEVLRQSQRFILILDGYDEIPAEHRNLYADEKLDKWQAKIMISSRPEYLSEGYQNHFQPRGYSRSLLEYELAPFSEQVIENYIDQYVKHARPPWNAQAYRDALDRIPNVKELLGTPFLLKMALIVLPTLEDATQGLTRIKLYEQFMRTWFERSLARLDGIRLTQAQKTAFQRLKEEGFTEHSERFNADFALAMYEAKTTVAEYSAIPRRGAPQNKQYEAFLSSKDEEKNLLRFSAPLIRQNQHYRFIHKSIQDYLVARAVWEELENSSGRDVSMGVEPLSGIKAMRLLLEELDASIQVDSSALLNHFNLVEDLAIQGFLVERLQQNRALVKPLLAWIKASTTEKSASTAAANAITILVKAEVPFTRADLKRIRIVGADLSYGIFDHTQFSGADLRKVNLQGVWLRGADLSGAQMEAVQFGEKPSLLLAAGVRACCYSPDGRWLAVTQDYTIQLYDAHALELIYTFEGHISMVNSVVFSPDSKMLVSVSWDHVKLWSVEDKMRLLKTFKGHTQGANSVVFSPDGKMLASGSRDHTVKLWSLDDKAAALLKVFKGHTASVESVAFSPDGKTLASGSDFSDRTVKLWSLDDKAALLKTFKGHTWSVKSVVFSPDGKTLASGSDDHTVKLWAVEDEMRLLKTFEGHTLWVKSVVFSPNGKTLASGSSDHTVKLWSVEDETRSPKTFAGHAGGVNSVVFSKDGKTLTSGSEDRTVKFWSVDGEMHSPKTFAGHAGRVNSVVFSKDGKMLASGSYDMTVKLWAVEDGMRLLKTFEGHTLSVTSVVFSPDGTILASVSDGDSTLKLWAVEDGMRLLKTFEGYRYSGGFKIVAFSPDGKTLVSGSDDHTVRLWAVNGEKNRQKIFKGHTSSVFSVVYSPSGAQIASGSSDMTVKLWSVEDETCPLKNLRGAYP
ncbi:hypothetical protein EBME_0692 [bacterium endosymbiont of Mortierella elongata FMR23-6]|nr:hypothetical protein EBME_0692 [bacterium endosymbiont of Mortierella elongata FMR23-6]